MVACIFVLVSGSSDGGKDLGSSIGYVVPLYVHFPLLLIQLQIHPHHRCPLVPPVVQVNILSSAPHFVAHKHSRPIYNAYMKVDALPKKAYLS